MASSHKNTLHELVVFSRQHFYISVIATLVLLVYAYWDVIKLRYFSNFFGTGELSAEYQELFIAGFGNNLTNHFSVMVPIVVIFSLASIVAYTLYNSYKNTVFDMHVNYNYVNVKKHNPLHISLHYVVLYSAAFVLPLLYWCFYFISWFPEIAKMPLKYIVGTNTLLFIFIASVLFISMIVLTHIGLILTRLMIRLFKVN